MLNCNFGVQKITKLKLKMNKTLLKFLIENQNTVAKTLKKSGKKQVHLEFKNIYIREKLNLIQKQPLKKKKYKVIFNIQVKVISSQAGQKYCIMKELVDFLIRKYILRKENFLILNYMDQEG